VIEGSEDGGGGAALFGLVFGGLDEGFEGGQRGLAARGVLHFVVVAQPGGDVGAGGPDVEVEEVGGGRHKGQGTRHKGSGGILRFLGFAGLARRGLCGEAVGQSAVRGASLEFGGEGGVVLAEGEEAGEEGAVLRG
jgi:hypothetical protein